LWVRIIRVLTVIIIAMIIIVVIVSIIFMSFPISFNCEVVFASYAIIVHIKAEG